MRSIQEQVAVSTGREGEITQSRSAHEHLWAAVDVPLTEFPHAAEMRSAVEDCELKDSLAFLSLTRDGTSPVGYVMFLETGAAHSQPSGATQDRRLWVEVTGYNANDKVVFESGVVADGAVEGTPTTHPCMFRDVIRDDSGAETHMFWKAAHEPTGTDTKLLPTGTMRGVRHGLDCSFQSAQMPVRFQVRVRMRPIGVEVMQSLVQSGHLDPAIAAKMPTLSVATYEFALDPKTNDFALTGKSKRDCDTYKCMLDPKSLACGRVTAR
jgi:hypothetical protein